jgi:hypothetical protein
MNRLRNLTQLGLLLIVAALPSFAGDWIVTLQDSGKSSAMTQAYAAFLKARLHGNDMFLVTLPPALENLLVQALKAFPGVQSVVADAAMNLPEAPGHTKRAYPDPNIMTCPTSSKPVKSGSLPPPSYYLNQPAVCLVNLPLAQQRYGRGLATTRMALIDTWVDVGHSGFGGSIDLLRSASFFNPQSGPGKLVSETSPMVDGETSPMVDGMGAIILNGETSPMVDGETSPMVDGETSPMVDKVLGPYWGHGTGVAGIMHLAAPGASIVVLQAFDSHTGSANLSSIVAAIYYAVEQAHVNVINMSFTAPSNTPQIDSLAKAIAYAQSKGVVIVGSVPDSGGPRSYPAGYTGVSSVACTDNSDKVCDFSGRVDWATIYAPGYLVMSLYPRDAAGKERHALFTGTSFSAPWATGTGALMVLPPNAPGNSPGVANDLQQGADKVRGVLRLDMYGALKN